MKGILFSDSIILRLTVRLGELVMLNICYLLCCLPVFTIGAATAAMYAVCFRLGTRQEKKLLISFFREFRHNLKKGTILQLILVLVCAVGCYLVLLFLGASGAARIGLLPSLVLLLVFLIVAGYTFPLLSLFDNTCAATLKNALILGLGYLPRSVCVVAVNLAPVILLLADFELFLRLSILLLFLYFSVTAYLNTILLRKVFAPYLPQEPEA
jgi:uncharacterized membrane protein YesL